MTTHDPIHSPTPEFRASLERDVLQAFHDERPALKPRRLARFRTPMTLAAGLVIGMGSQFAVGQVQKNRVRDDLELSIEYKRQVAASRLELAKANYDLAKRKFDVGSVSRTDLLAAEADLRAEEAAAFRVRLDLQEVRETAMAPRDELWAPLVGSRDFVKERLNADASAAQRKLESVQAAAAEAERAFGVGMITRAALDDALATAEQAKSDFDLIAYRITLRRQALEEHTSPEVVTQRLERIQRVRDVQRIERSLEALQRQSNSARDRLNAGVVDSLEVLRLRVRVLEMRAELQRVRARLQSLKSPE